MPKKKGPDPEEEKRLLEELKLAEREEYMKLFAKEKAKSMTHRTRSGAGSDAAKGKVPGFDPHPQDRIGDEEVDRLIVRRGDKAKAWEDPADDEPIAGAGDIGGDADGQEILESLRATQAELFENLRSVQCEVAGCEGRADIEGLESDVARVEDSVEGDPCVEPSAGALSEMRHDFFATPGGGDAAGLDAAAEQAASEAYGSIEILLKLWKKRCEIGHQGGLIAELCRHLHATRGRMTLLQQAVACRYGEKNPGRTNAELLVLFLYCCDAVEIDRILQVDPRLDSGCPEGYKARSPAIRHEIDRALRDRDLRGIFDWIYFISTLTCCSTRLSADKIGHTLYRGLRGLTPEQVATLKQAKTDELHFLPALSVFSFDVDAAVGDDYRQADAAVLTIRGARVGTDLSHCVNARVEEGQRPKDGEVVLPPLTCLRVKDVKYEQGLRVTYDYHGALMHPATSGDLTHFRDDWRKQFQNYRIEVREHCRKLDGELRLLQRYQCVYRKLHLHKATMNQLGKTIREKEDERENKQMEIDKNARGKPTAAMLKELEEIQKGMDEGKSEVLDQHCNTARKDQDRMERELVSLKAAIDGGTEELLRTETVDAADPDLKKLLQMQTEQYNNMVRLYEREAKQVEKLEAKVVSLKPIPKKGGRGKPGK